MLATWHFHIEVSSKCTLRCPRCARQEVPNGLVNTELDTQGVENALALLKKMSCERHKSIWLVSHRDELAGRVENILKVIRENGFTSYNTDVELT